MIEELWKNSAIIAKRNVDSNQTPISVKLLELKQIIDVHSCVVLNQLPDESYGINIDGYTEVYDIEDITTKSFKVDYANGVIYFHPYNAGKNIVVDYSGMGCTLLSASRIYTKYDKYGNVLETLEELIDKAKLYLKAIESLGGAVEVINKLDVDIENGTVLHENLTNDISVATPLQANLRSDIEEGGVLLPKLTDANTTATQKKIALDQSITSATNTNTLLTNTNQTATQTNLTLQQTIATGQDSVNKINATGNKSLVIGSSQFTNNAYTWTHNMNNDSLIVNFIDSATNEPLLPDYKIVDKNNILIRNSAEHPNIKVVLSASFYQGNALFGTNVEEFANDSITTGAKKVRLKDGNGVVENPITDSDAVFMPDGTTKLTKKINDISSSLAQKEKYEVNLYEVGCVPNVSDCTDVINELIRQGKKILIPPGEWIIEGVIDLSKSPNLSYNIQGVGENSILKLCGVNAKLYDTYRINDKQQYRLKTIKDISIVGDYTNTGFDFRGLQLLAENIKFEKLNIGLNIEDGGYLSTFINCYIVDCNTGVRFGDLATTVEFINFHARLNHSQKGSCVVYDGQGIEKINIHGSIQGNYSTAIDFNKFTGDTELDIYFELNGEKSKNIPSIRNGDNRGYITYKNCKIPRNVNSSGTWESGDYIFGGHVVFDNCRLTGTMDFTEVKSLQINNCRMHDITVPKKAYYSGLCKFEFLGNGSFLTTQPKNIQNEIIYENINSDPFSENSSCVVSTGSNKPNVVIDSENKLFNKNVSNITLNNISGTIGDNCVLLNTNLSQIYLEPDEVICCSFIAKSNIESDFRVHFTGGTQALIKDITIGTEFNKFVFIGKNNISETKKCLPYFYPLDDSGATVTITGITIIKGLKSEDLEEINFFINS